MKNLLILFLLSTISLSLFAQQETEIRPDGIVTPKITNAQRPTPALLGHMVYNTDQDQFEYYNGSNWVPFAGGSGASNQIIDGNTWAKVYDATTPPRMEVYLNGSKTWELKTTGGGAPKLETFGLNSIFIGNDAGNFTENTSQYNIGIGDNAMQQTTTATHNTAIGVNALFQNTIGGHNIALGPNSAFENTTGARNISIGSSALRRAKQKSDNVAIGDSSMYNIGGTGINAFANNNTAVGSGSLFGKGDNFGYNSVALGYHAGYNGGTQSVFVGSKAGFVGANNSVFIGNEAGGQSLVNYQKNNALYIENDNGIPLIYGEFDNRIVEVDGQLKAKVDGVSSSPAYVGVLESIPSKRPSLLFSIGGNQSYSGMSLEYDANNVNSQFNFRNDLNTIFFSVVENGDVDVYGDLNSRVGALILKSEEATGITINTNGTVDLPNKLTVNNEVEIDGPLLVNNLSGAGQADVQANPFGALVRVSSDARLKKDVETIDGALEKVMQLRGVSYNWKHQVNENRTLGVIAQEVLPILPDVVTKNGEYYGVNYSEFPALLIEAIKEQQAIIERQKTNMAGQQQKQLDTDRLLKALTNRLDNLESATTISVSDK